MKIKVILVNKVIIVIINKILNMIINTEQKIQNKIIIMKIYTIKTNKTK